MALVDRSDDVAIAGVTAAELLAGVELSDAGHRDARSAHVEETLSRLQVEDYDLEVARAHASLIAHVRRTGRPRGAHDLMIAATALARGRTVVTLDRAGFEGLPGVTVLGSPLSRGVPTSTVWAGSSA